MPKKKPRFPWARVTLILSLLLVTAGLLLAYLGAQSRVSRLQASLETANASLMRKDEQPAPRVDSELADIEAIGTKLSDANERIAEDQTIIHRLLRDRARARTAYYGCEVIGTADQCFRQP